MWDGGLSVRTAAVVWQDMLKTLGRGMENSLSFIPPRLPVCTAASILYCTRHAVLHQPVKLLRFRMFYTHSTPSVSCSCHTKSSHRWADSKHFNPKTKQPYQSNRRCCPAHCRGRTYKATQSKIAVLSLSEF